MDFAEFAGRNMMKAGLIPLCLKSLTMPRIVLTAEQASDCLAATDRIEICDPQGKRLGYLARGVSAQDLEIARQRLTSNEPCYTFEQVMAKLQSLAKL